MNTPILKEVYPNLKPQPQDDSGRSVMDPSKMQKAAMRKMRHGKKPGKNMFTKAIHYLGGQKSPSGAGSSDFGSYPPGHGAANPQGTMRAPHKFGAKR